MACLLQPDIKSMGMQWLNTVNSRWIALKSKKIDDHAKHDFHETRCLYHGDQQILRRHYVEEHSSLRDRINRTGLLSVINSVVMCRNQGIAPL